MQNNLWNMDEFFRLIPFLMVLVKTPISDGASCGNNDYIGENNPQSKANAIDSQTGLGILLDADDNEYTFDCCGLIDSWQIYAEYSGDVYLQVWRNSGGIWTLLGQNFYTVSGAEAQSEVTISIASNDQISVQNGDVIGIYTPGTPIVTYKNEGGPWWAQNHHYYLDNTIGNLNVGATHSWSSRQQGRDYAIKALLSGGNSPTFSGNLPDTVTFPDTTPTGTLIKAILATDADTLDTLVYTMTSSSSSFSFDTNTLQVTSVGALSSSSATSTTTLSFQVTDDCGNTDTESLKVEVINSVPVIHNLPSSVDVSEGQTTELLLFTLNVSDDSLADTVTCSLPSVSPTTSNFFLKVTGTSDYGVYIKALPTLDYDTTSFYSLTISCSDTKESASGTMSVYILRNNPPTITNLGNAVSAYVPSTTTSGALIYTVVSTDQENDALYYNMTCSQSLCPFDIMNSGQVQTNTNLASITTAGYDLYIYVYDGHTLVGPETLTIVITDVNYAPSITNLPLSSTIAVPENTVLGASIYQVTAYDANVNDILVYTAAYTPSSSSAYLSLDLTGLLVTSSNILDFESLATTTITIAVTISDGFSSDTENLVLTIVDVNEPPQFDKSKYSITGNEGSAGSSIGIPQFTVTDPDNGVTLTYLISCQEFIMDAITAEVSFAATFDLDISGTSGIIACDVIVTDGELSATAELEITISDVNDNSPKFASSTFVFYAYPNIAVGTVLGSIVATDDDLGVNGDIIYTLDQSSLSVPYFGVQSNGNFYVMESLVTFSTGQTLSISGIATDTGGLADTCNITIVIQQSTATTQGTTSEHYISFIEDGKNVAWLTVLILCFATITTVVSITAFKAYRCGDLFKSCRDMKTGRIEEHSMKLKGRSLRSEHEFYHIKTQR